MLSETGIRLPPIARKPATAPTDVVLSLAPFGFQLATPAVKLMFARPSVARAPNAVPFPASVLGKPRSPSMVTPVPPLGLFHAGIPAHWATAGVAAPAIIVTSTAIRFIEILQREYSGCLPPHCGHTVGSRSRQVNLCQPNAPTRR